MPPLPPLPASSVGWKAILPRRLLRYSMDRTNRDFVGRVLLTNPHIARDFVRALRLRENEVVVEAFPGPGVITRELLNGGNEEGSDALPRPKVVVACEPSPDFLVKGLGLKEELVPPIIPAKFESEDYAIHQSNIIPSDDPRLIMSPSTPYRWPTLPQMLSNEWTAPHLPVFDPLAPPGPAVTKRPWNAPPPPITLVSQMPASVAGDQMIAQWIGSAVGEPDGQRSWIWEWGRLRLAMLVGKNQYDRMMAGPSEKIFCKLSVITRALFHVSALPPYHHVFNVDKGSTRTESTSITPPLSKMKKLGLKDIPPPPPPPDPYPRTTTYPDDFYPIARGHTKHVDIPFDRPIMLGILLEPRLDSPINSENKDEWDFVLRKCFVTEAQTLRKSLKNLAFGAEHLEEKISQEGETRYAGIAVDCNKITRDVDVDEWTRIVDVFKKWAFKPTNLILDTRADQDSRYFGQD